MTVLFHLLNRIRLPLTYPFTDHPIMNLCDISKSGSLDQNQFALAMHLIRRKTQGLSLPLVLPPPTEEPAPLLPTRTSLPPSAPFTSKISTPELPLIASKSVAGSVVAPSVDKHSFMAQDASMYNEMKDLHRRFTEAQVCCSYAQMHTHSCTFIIIVLFYLCTLMFFKFLFAILMFFV